MRRFLVLLLLTLSLASVPIATSKAVISRSSFRFGAMAGQQRRVRRYSGYRGSVRARVASVGAIAG